MTASLFVRRGQGRLWAACRCSGGGQPGLVPPPRVPSPAGRQPRPPAGGDAHDPRSLAERQADGAGARPAGRRRPAPVGGLPQLPAVLQYPAAAWAAPHCCAQPCPHRPPPFLPFRRRRTFTSSTAPSWSPGTAPPWWPSPTGATSAPPWTATVCARAGEGEAHPGRKGAHPGPAPPAPAAPPPSRHQACRRRREAPP